jgi:hypothetical protein
MRAKGQGMKVAFSFVTCCLMVGCQYDPYASNYTTKAPGRKQVAGRYQMDSDSVNIVRSSGFQIQEATIELHEDGWFSAENLPTTDFKGIQGVAKKTGGQYSIEEVAFSDSTSFWGLAFRPDGTKAVLCNQSPPYIIHFIIGDPDEGRCLDYQLVPKAQ